MKRKSTTLAVAAALLAAGPVLAQDIKVNVTGSNIKRTEAETAAPVEVITREDIHASGLQTIAAVVQSITANNNGTISNSFVNGFAAGASGVSRRGLGANNTLVLLNGRRLAVYGLADDGQRSFVDLNQVPFDAVDRIEVLKDGASAILRLGRRSWRGEHHLRQRSPESPPPRPAARPTKGDGDRWQGAVTAASASHQDRYNAFITIDGRHQDAIPTATGASTSAPTISRLWACPTRVGNPFSGYGSSSLVGNVGPSSGPIPGPPALPVALGCAPSVWMPTASAAGHQDYLSIQPRREHQRVARARTDRDTTGVRRVLVLQSKVSTQFTPGVPHDFVPTRRRKA
jgi:hypothetical protein